MFTNNKIWKVQNDNNTYSDEELVELIKNGKINYDTRITNKDLKKWLKVEETLYNYYLREEENEEKA